MRRIWTSLLLKPLQVDAYSLVSFLGQLSLLPVMQTLLSLAFILVAFERSLQRFPAAPLYPARMGYVTTGSPEKDIDITCSYRGVESPSEGGWSPSRRSCMAFPLSLHLVRSGGLGGRDGNHSHRGLAAFPQDSSPPLSLPFSTFPMLPF